MATGLMACSIPMYALSLEVSPGSLASLINDENRDAVSLSLSGSIDKRDFDVLGDALPALKELDLSQVTIVEYRPKKPQGMMFAQYDALTLPPGALLAKGLTSLRLPDNLVAIGEEALAGNLFTSIVIPASVTAVGDNAFYGCQQIETIEIPASVKQMGLYAFAHCPALTRVDFALGSALSGIPAHAFEQCTALASVTLPDRLTEIGEAAFAGCSALQQIELPDALTTIGPRAFVAGGLTTVRLPASLSGVGDFAFALCPALTRVSLSGRPELGDGLFFYCPVLSAVEMPGDSDEPISYPDYLFAGSPELVLPSGLQGVETVGRYALKDNASPALALGADLASLADGALEGMTSLTQIDARELGMRVPELGTDVFAGINQPSVTLIVADGEDTTPWQTAAQWKEFNITTFSTVTSPGAAAPNIKAWRSGSQLLVRSSEIISEIQVYSPDGLLLVSLSPDDTAATIDMTGFSGTIFLIKVACRGCVTTFKLQ